MVCIAQNIYELINHALLIYDWWLYLLCLYNIQFLADDDWLHGDAYLNPLRVNLPNHYVTCGTRSKN